MTYNYPFWGFPSLRRSYYYQRPNYYNPSYYRPNNAVSSHSNNLKNSNNNSCTNHPNNLNKSSNNNSSNTFNNNINNSSCSTKKEPTSFFDFPNESKKVDFSCDDNFYDDTEFLNIFGFSLHIDDLLILVLLFFLYQEGVDDIYLYIALFLLLLS